VKNEKLSVHMKGIENQS